MKIAIGCDHTGVDLKNEIIKHLNDKEIVVIDCGTYNIQSTHYPIYGFEVARQVVLKNAEFGIVICGSGIGITNTANKIKHIRCFLANSYETVRIAKKRWNANVIGFGANITTPTLANEMIDIFLSTKYLKNNDQQLELIDKKIIHDNHDLRQFDKSIDSWINNESVCIDKKIKITLPKTWKK